MMVLDDDVVEGEENFPAVIVSASPMPAVIIDTPNVTESKLSLCWQCKYNLDARLCPFRPAFMATFPCDMQCKGAVLYNYMYVK